MSPAQALVLFRRAHELAANLNDDLDALGEGWHANAEGAIRDRFEKAAGGASELAGILSLLAERSRKDG